ncbi:MAG: C45 family peptidase [Chloroflexi bacterium]|nr:C45 family peptidase [Chloroflexota bacterium]
MGRQIGEAMRPRIQNSLENARNLLASAYSTLQLTWENAQIQASKYIPFAQEYYPQYVDELMGISAGANISFDDLAVLNGMEAVTMDALHLTKCTSIAVNQERTADGHVIIAHNEDWVPEDEEDVYILHARPDHEPPYLAMNYGGLLPNIGFNAYGIAQCADSVYPSDCRVGIPRLVASRAVLSAPTLSGAIRHMLVPHRAAGYNHMLAHESGELYNIEVSARHFAVLYAHEGYIVHTNHYLDAGMRAVESESDELVSTRVRYFRALRLIRKTPLHTVDSLRNILKDHVNFEDSICNHAVDFSRPLDREKTIVSLLIDLTTRQMQACWGNPCENEYYTYELNC